DGRRVMVLRSMLVGGVLIALMSLAQNVEQFLVLRILQGALTGTVAASTALVATIVPRDRLASSMGLLQTSAYLGIAGGPTLGGLVAEAVGIRGTFVVAGALLGGGGAAVWLFVHEHYQPLTERRPGFIRSLQVGLSSPAVRPLLVVLFLIQVSSAIVFPILPLVVQHLAAPGDPVKLYAGLAFGVTAMFRAMAPCSAWPAASLPWAPPSDPWLAPPSRPASACHRYFSRRPRCWGCLASGSR